MSKSYKVALASYPIIFQQPGGLGVQMRQTLAALQRLGVDVKLFDYCVDQLTDFDLLHVFSAINSNHRLIEEARNQGVPVALSTVLHPPWTAFMERRAKFLSNVVGRCSGWQLSTTHTQIKHALALSSTIIALGHREYDMLAQGYRVPTQKLHIVPNGIQPSFFEASPELFRQHFAIDSPFVLNVAYISPYKNQLAIAQAARTQLPVVLIGPCAEDAKGYLQQVLEAGGEQCRYLGPMDNNDPLLASAFAAASLFALPSLTEVQPIAVLEALAAGTPVLMTTHHSLDILEDTACIKEIPPNFVDQLQQELKQWLDSPPSRGRCQASVRHLKWDDVAHQLINIYEQTITDIPKVAV